MKSIESRWGHFFITCKAHFAGDSQRAFFITSNTRNCFPSVTSRDKTPIGHILLLTYDRENIAS